MEILYFSSILSLICCYSASAGPSGFFPFSDNFRENGFSLVNLQQPQIAESASEWLRDIKAKVSDAPPVFTQFRSLAETERSNFEDRRKLFQNFFMDMSQMTFDPSKDWGFHIGPWYFIRKDGDDLISSLWTLLKPKSPLPTATSDAAWLEYDFDNDKKNPSTTSNTAAPESATTLKETTNAVNVKDNTTLNQSAEVINPNS